MKTVHVLLVVKEQKDIILKKLHLSHEKNSNFSDLDRCHRTMIQRKDRINNLTRPTVVSTHHSWMSHFYYAVKEVN